MSAGCAVPRGWRCTLRVHRTTLLSREHLLELAAAGEKGLELLRLLALERADLGLHPLGKEGQCTAVDLVRLLEQSCGLGEVPDLPGIDHDNRQGSGSQGSDRGTLIAAGGLQHDQCGRSFLQERDQGGDSRLVIGNVPALGRGTQRHIQALLGDIDSDVHGCLAHQILLRSSSCVEDRLALPCKDSGSCSLWPRR